MPGSVPLALGLDTVGLQVPWYFRCPISLELMQDPVTVATGQTYDRASIESWVATGNTTCPVTRAPLADFTLIPNHTLRRLIQEWCVAHRSLGVERIPTPRVVLGAADGVIEGLVALVDEKANARAVRIGIRGLFALCLAKENRQRAVSAGAASALARRVAEGGCVGELERALAAVERLSRTEGGREAVVSGAGGGAAVVIALVRAMSGRGAEHAAGALVAVVGGSEGLQLEAVRAGAMSQLLMMVQGGCSERAKRKAQHLLKLLRSAWPTTDSMANSADFLQPY
ncbi:unnamed protein product [Triticum turgidum subsp. durum]|uniref:U-box domain-containing protein n=1 Tax=Triticum turgidum subsp. durum TaxID=4567 RepID=A0A9R1B1J2_TRITD|nr:unnamed protein product [Triticum turgidum subsp. durum]